MSQRSGASTPSLQVPPPRIGRRGRSSTLGSLGRSVEQDSNDSPPQLTPSGRNSTSTGGRKSFGDIFSLSHRLRQNSEPPPRNGSGLPGTPGSTGSKATSLQISRELTYPRRGDEDTPATYLAKLEAAVPRGYMATILCKGSDEFSKTCLRKYMRGFSYFVDSIDMAIRKMLMEVELPKETQQIDRLLQGFADRYCECNPGIFVSVDEAYFVAFSILLLHSDTHNKNNKRKMQKQDYVKNTQDQVEVSNDILECFYDNISYTPFIHFEDEVAINSHRLTVPKPRKSLFRTPSTESLRGPVDPYTLILDSKLDTLRPSLKDVMDTEDTYNSLGTSPELDVASLHNGFFRSGIIQIVSARSRPDAFLTQATISNPAEAQAGLVDIKAAKVGLLWRKDPKKKKTKSPWQEWGAILTSSQLYFFRDVGWIKRLMFQHESHQKSGSHTEPVLFKPPLISFEPDALMSMDDAVALLDSSYKKHKHAFVFIKHGGFEEVFLANDEADMNDWIAKLNYAATFRTAGVRMRGHIGQAYGGQQRPVAQSNPLDLAENVTPLEETEPNNYATDVRLLEQIISYRRQIMEDKIKEATEKLALAQKELDSLLRNARHLQVLTPIQAKTREALILATGRMSAKLKWIRVEMARTKCHRDILKLDLNEGAAAVALIETSPLTPTQQKTSPLRSDRHSLTSSDLRIFETLSIPKSPVIPQKPGSDSPSVTEKMKGSDGSYRPLSNVPSRASEHKSVNSLDVPTSAGNNSTSSSREAIHLVTSNPGLHSLAHQASIISSHHPRRGSDSRLMSPTLDLDNGEKQVLREAGLLGADGTPPSGKRPGTSGSDRDRLGSISTLDGTPRDRGSVRRSLQRSLRESQHAPHRGKKGRDSNSSVAFTEDGRSVSGESDGLTRGTGSFIVHGKKASVITLGSEWQSMSNEERLRLRKLAQKENTKEEAVAEDGTASTVSAPIAVVDTKSLTNSTTTAATEQQEEAETSEVSKEVIEGSGHTEDFHSGFIPPPELRHSPQLQTLQA
jgi:ribosomal protein S18